MRQLFDGRRERNWKKKIEQKDAVLVKFALYVQIKMGRILTRSRAQNLREFKKPIQEQENAIVILIKLDPDERIHQWEVSLISLMNSFLDFIDKRIKTHLS